MVSNINMPTTKGKKYNIKHKERIKKVFERVLESSGKSVSKAMRGIYPKSTSKNPQQITRSKSWAILTKQYLPESLIAEKHNALLNKEEYVTKNNMTTGEIDVIPTGQIDVQAVKAGLDMYYKVAGKYAKEGNVTAIQINIDKFKDSYAL